MTYDLRRLARKGFIVREKGTHRYRLTSDGRRLAMFFTKTYARIVTPTLAYLDPALRGLRPLTGGRGLAPPRTNSRRPY